MQTSSSWSSVCSGLGVDGRAGQAPEEAHKVSENVEVNLQHAAIARSTSTSIFCFCFTPDSDPSGSGSGWTAMAARCLPSIGLVGPYRLPSPWCSSLRPPSPPKLPIASLLRPAWSPTIRQYGHWTASPTRSVSETLVRSKTRPLSARFFSSSPFRSARPTYYPRGGPLRRPLPQPPRPSSKLVSTIKRTLNAFSPQTFLFLIMGLNIVVFVLWRLSISLYQEGSPAWLITMTHNFTCSWDNLRSGRLWTLITPAFSHIQPSHIFFNLLAMYFVAGPLVGGLGNPLFAGLYLFCGAAGNVVSLVFERFLEADKAGPGTTRTGASGAVMGCLAYVPTSVPSHPHPTSFPDRFVAAAQPFSTFQLYFFIPVPAWLAISAIFVYDLYGALVQPRRTWESGVVDSAGHIGGMYVLFF